MNRLLLSFYTLFWLLAFNPSVYACSMFKITINGRTMVGNNEDYWNPHTRIWFEKGLDKQYGVAYVGFNDLYPQGAINEAGLVFDGFSMPSHAPLKSTKPELPDDFSWKTIMKRCKSVSEVSAVFNKYNFSKAMSNAMVLFVDRSGDYLIVEPDTMIRGNNASYMLSNYCPSTTKNLNDVNISFFQNGRQYLAAHPAKATLNYCASIMNSMHQSVNYSNQGEVTGTKYTTIYDLQTGNIFLYYNHNYNRYVKFNLKQELSKGNRVLKINELFPYNKSGYGAIKVQEYGSYKCPPCAAGCDEQRFLKAGKCYVCGMQLQSAGVIGK